MNAQYRVDSIFQDEELGDYFAKCFDLIYDEEFEKYLGLPDEYDGKQNASTLLKDSAYEMSDEVREEIMTTFKIEEFEDEESFSYPDDFEYDEWEEEEADEMAYAESFNLRETLNRIDLNTDNRYDLLNLYEACDLDAKEKRALGKIVYSQQSPEVIYDALNNRFVNGDEITNEEVGGGFKPGDKVLVKPSKKTGTVAKVNGDYIDVEINGGKDPDRRDTFYPNDLEPLNEDVNKEDLKSKLERATRDFVVNTLGYDDEFVNDYIVVSVTDSNFYEGEPAIKCEVRTELDYEECSRLAYALNPIVEAEDKQAYFDMETNNVTVAYLRTDFSDDVVEEKFVADFAPIIARVNSMDELRKLYQDIKDSFEGVWTYATFEAVHELIMAKADELNGDTVTESVLNEEEYWTSDAMLSNKSNSGINRVLEQRFKKTFSYFGEFPKALEFIAKILRDAVQLVVYECSDDAEDREITANRTNNRIHGGGKLGLWEVQSGIEMLKTCLHNHKTSDNGRSLEQVDALLTAMFNFKKDKEFKTNLSDAEEMAWLLSHIRQFYIAYVEKHGGVRTDKPADETPKNNVVSDEEVTEYTDNLISNICKNYKFGNGETPHFFVSGAGVGVRSDNVAYLEIQAIEERYRDNLQIDIDDIPVEAVKDIKSFKSHCEKLILAEFEKEFLRAFKGSKKVSENLSGYLKEDINDPDEVLDFKRNVEAAEDLVDIENLIWGLSDGVAEEMVQQAFDANQDAEDIQVVKDAIIRELDIYLEDNEWLGESLFDDDEDGKAYTYTQVYDELKLETRNFTIEGDTIQYGYTSEAEFAERILKRHYASVDRNDCRLTFKDCKHKGSR